MESTNMDPSGRPIAIGGVAFLHLLVALCNAVAFGGDPPNDEWAIGWFFGTPFAQSSLLAVWVALGGWPFSRRLPLVLGLLAYALLFGFRIRFSTTFALLLLFDLMETVLIFANMLYFRRFLIMTLCILSRIGEKTKPIQSQFSTTEVRRQNTEDRTKSTGWLDCGNALFSFDK